MYKQRVLLNKALVIGILILFIGVTIASGITFKINLPNNLSDEKAKDTLLYSSNVILDENFSGTFLPEGWSTDCWTQSNTCCCDSEPPSAYLLPYNQSQYDGYIISKAIDASDYEIVYLRFFCGIEGFYGRYYSYYVKLRMNETSPWQDITPWDNPFGMDFCDWVEIEINCSPNKCGDALQIKWTAMGYYYYGGWEACLDDVKILGNNPPYEPSNPDPPDGAENVSNATFCWTGGDPDGDDVMYDVYFGNCSPPPLISNNQTWNCLDLSPYWFLDFNTTYYWKIVAWDWYGASIPGPIWSFTTEPNYPPDPAHDPIPPDGANMVPPDAILYWKGSDPNSWDKLTYDVYFSINFPPKLVSYNQSESYFDPYGTDDMPFYQDYFWMIVTRVREGEETLGPNWTFDTDLGIPPNTPEIDGPAYGKVGVDYDFTFVICDPDARDFFFYIDWDDGTADECIGPYPSGEVVTVNHTWYEKGCYIIRCKAKDIYGAESNWGKYIFWVDRSRISYGSLFPWLFERFPLLEVFLRTMNLLR